MAFHDSGRASLRLSAFAPRKEMFMTGNLSRSESRQITGSLLASRVPLPARQSLVLPESLEAL